MDELVKMLRVCGDSNNSCGNCPVCENDGSCPHGEWEFAAEKYMLQAADAIEELQQIAGHHEQTAKDYWKEACDYKAAIPRWIPVTERLPENPRDVLVTLKSFLRPNAVYLNFAAYENGAWYEPDGSNPFRIANDRVTHWMPLPEPPKEEK